MHIILIYLGILIGTFFEGEMIMISSIIAAHHGYLNIWFVVLAGSTGAFCSDCFYFYLGRKKGIEWLNKKQKFKNKIEFVHKKIEKFPVLTFLVYRFLYGFRIVTPLVIGTSGTKRSTFHFFSTISIIIWATTYFTIGYLFGELIKSKLGYIEHIEKYIIGFLVLIGIVFILIFRVRKLNKKVIPTS